MYAKVYIVILSQLKERMDGMHLVSLCSEAISCFPWNHHVKITPSFSLPNFETSGNDVENHSGYINVPNNFLAILSEATFTLG